jgi:hypothetical protein
VVRYRVQTGKRLLIPYKRFPTPAHRLALGLLAPSSTHPLDQPVKRGSPFLTTSFAPGPARRVEQGSHQRLALVIVPQLSDHRAPRADLTRVTRSTSGSTSALTMLWHHCKLSQRGA